MLEGFTTEVGNDVGEWLHAQKWSGLQVVSQQEWAWRYLYSTKSHNLFT